MVKNIQRAQKFAVNISLGMSGFLIWSLIVLGVFSASALFFLSSYRPSLTHASLTYQPQRLFAAIPSVFTLFGYTQGENDPRAAQLEKYLLSKNSPMASASKILVAVADACPMDWTLLPAIAGKESAFGRIIPLGSFNAFGWAVYSGQNYGAAFTSWDNAIQKVGEGLCQNYIQKGLSTPEQIEQLYTPQSALTHGGWRADVSYMMEEIKSWR